MNLTEIELSINNLHHGYRSNIFTPVDVVKEVYRRIARLGDAQIWTSIFPMEEALSCAAALKKFSVQDLPTLYGVPFSVKDNIDVAHVKTTCGCEGFRRHPEKSAFAVEKALVAGALYIGKNTLDQFATGLSGTRGLPKYPRNAFDDRYISGGSSSGSALAVSLGVVTFSLGTDTGGSGRVPAAMNNIVGIKPSNGLVSSNGLIFNNRSLDCISIFSLSVADGYNVLNVIRGFDESDEYSRIDSPDISLYAPTLGEFRFGIPDASHLNFFGDKLAELAFNKAVADLREIGGTPVVVDFSLFKEAGRLLFETGLLAERLVSYRHVLNDAPSTLHPAVRKILEKGSRYKADEIFEAIYRLKGLRRDARELFKMFDILVTPTVGRAYTCDEVEKDQFAVNDNIGYYTYFVNPLNLCALALPASIRDDGLPFGISVSSLFGKDGYLRSIGERFLCHIGLRGGLINRVSEAE